MEDLKQSPDVQEVEKSVTMFVDQAGKIVVTNNEQLVVANGLLLQTKEQIKAIEHRLEPAKKKAYDAYQEWLKLIKELRAPLDKLEIELKREMSRYWGEEERKTREEAARLEKERLEKAVSLEQAGDTIGAEAVLGIAIQAPKDVKMAAPMPKVDQRMFREIWRAEVFDIMALCKAVVTGEAGSDLILPNMSRLHMIAREKKSSMKISGVKAVRDQ